MDVAIEERVRFGDVWKLGDHRLMCGDSTARADVTRLMAGERASICFTSPPYDNQRSYAAGKIDWTPLMKGVFEALLVTGDAQLFVNLGLVHHQCEWHPYWTEWMQWMRDEQWRRFGWYIWHQGEGLPGHWSGRLAPCFEFIFHFNRQTVVPKKITPCQGSGSRSLHGSKLRNKDGTAAHEKAHHGAAVSPFKIPDAVVHCFREKRPGLPTQHPAVFPVDLPAFFFAAYAQKGQIAYEPFAGGGTTLLAGEEAGVRVRAMEINPRYCDIALARWEAAGNQPVLLDRDENRQRRLPQSAAIFQQDLFSCVV